MRRLGAAVTVVERSARLLPREDQDVSDGIRAILEAEGVRFELGAECRSLAPSGDRIVVGAACGGGEGITGSHVLLAVGRQPNTDGLGLDLAGIRTDARGDIEVETSAAPAPKASGPWATAMAAARSRTRRGTTTRSCWRTCSTAIRGASPTAFPARRCFIDPALGRVGMTETEGLARAVHIHPTVTEPVPTLLQQLKPA